MRMDDDALHHVRSDIEEWLTRNGIRQLTTNINYVGAQEALTTSAGQARNTGQIAPALPARMTARAEISAIEATGTTVRLKGEFVYRKFPHNGERSQHSVRRNIAIH